LNEVKKMHEDPRKHQFEGVFLTWFEGKSDIQCSTCEDDCKRQKMNNPREGLARETEEDEEWNNSRLCPDELPKQSDEDKQKFVLFTHSEHGHAHRFRVIAHVAPC